MEGEGKALWDRREGLLADRHTCCHRFIFIILEMCVLAGICGGQEMDLNCSLGDGELPDVGAGDQPGSSSSVHSKPQSQLCSPGSDFQIGLLCEKPIERNRLWNENYFISRIKCY